MKGDIRLQNLEHNSYGATIPCYDEKNRRIVIASVWSQNIGENNEYHMVFRTNMVALTNDGVAIRTSGGRFYARD